MYVSGETFGYATEETNACPLLIYLVYTVTLILSVHKRVVKVWNYKNIKKYQIYLISKIYTFDYCLYFYKGSSSSAFIVNGNSSL